MRLFGFFSTVILLAVLASVVIQHPIAIALCPVIGYGSAWLWLPEVRWRLRIFLRTRWRRLRGRCEMCGGPWTKKDPNPLDIYSYAPVCRSCAKVLLAGRLYGMGNRKAYENCERLFKGCEV